MSVSICGTWAYIQGGAYIRGGLYSGGGAYSRRFTVYIFIYKHSEPEKC